MSIPDPTVLRSTLRGLERLGCQFVLLAGLSSKRPKTPIQKGWTAKRPSVDECFNHVQGGGQLGWVPKSMGLICADVDGPREADPAAVRAAWTAKDTAKLVRRVRKTIGDEGFVGSFNSLSALTTHNNKAHMVWKCAAGLDAPLGLKQDGQPYQTVNDTRFADVPGSWVDLKWGTQLLGLHYFPDLLGRLSPDVVNGPGTSKLGAVVTLLRAHKGKRKPRPETASLPALTDEGEPIKGRRAEKLIESFFKKHPTPVKGSRHARVRAWGMYAGGTERWLEGIVDEAWRRVRAANLPDEKIKQFESALADGRAAQLPRLPDDFKGTAKQWRDYFDQLPPDALNEFDSYPEAQRPKGGSEVLLCADTGCVGGSELDIATLYLAERRAADDLRINAVNNETVFRWDGSARLWVQREPNEILGELQQFASAHRERAPEPRWRGIESSGFARGVFQRIRGESPLYVNPAECFDSNPNLIGLPDGRVYDITPGEPRPTAKTDYVTQAVGLVPKSGPTPLFNKFLQDTFKGQAETAMFVLRFLGYMLTGHSREHLALFFYGKGGTGKSTLLDIFKFVAGDQYCGVVPHKTFWQEGYRENHPTEIMELKGRRAVVVDETPRVGKLRDDVFNAFVGGGELKGNRMRQDPESFRSQGKLIYASNFEPRLGDSTSGAARRVLVVEFKNVVPKHEQQRNRGLSDRILSTEAPAILDVLLKQAHQWAVRGLVPTPLTVQNDTDEFLKQSEPLRLFAEDSLEFGPDLSVSASALWTAWAAWCEANGFHKGNQQRFGRNFKRIFPTVVPEKTGTVNYLGVAIVTGF